MPGERIPIELEPARRSDRVEKTAAASRHGYGNQTGMHCRKPVDSVARA